MSSNSLELRAGLDGWAEASAGGLLSYAAGRAGDNEQRGPGKRPHALARGVSRLKHLPQQPEEHLCLRGDEPATCIL